MRRTLPTWMIESIPTSMFWGLILEDNKQYSQLVEKPFHISHAALGAIPRPATASDSDVPVFPNRVVEVHATIEKTDYVICYLDASKNILQLPLNLNISEGEEIVLYCKGQHENTMVYLTGYFIEESVVPFGLEDMTNDEYSVSELDTSSESCSEEDFDIRTLMFRDSLSSDDSSEEYNPRSLLDLLPSIEEVTDGSPEAEGRREATVGGKELGGLSKQVSGTNSRKRKRDQRHGSEGEGSSKLVKEEEGSSKRAREEEGSSKRVREEEGSSKRARKEEGSSKRAREEEGSSKRAREEEGSLKKKKKKKGKKERENHGQQESPHTSTATKKKGKNKPVKLKGGTEIQDTEIGQGKLAKPGKRVFVRYTGRLAHNNKVFDSNTSAKKPLMFKLGQSEVISGWDAGINGMKVGGKRQLIVPPNQGYGATGAPPAIPPHSKLIFDVKLLDVK